MNKGQIVFKTALIMFCAIFSMYGGAYDTDPSIVYPRYPHESPAQSRHPGIFENQHYDRFTSFEEGVVDSPKEDETPLNAKE